MIIETSDNRFFRVEETNRPDLAHVWFGSEVKRDKKTGEWVRKGPPRRWPLLVRKEASRVVEG